MRFKAFYWDILALFALALPLMTPFLANGLPNTADSEIHLHRIISAAVNLDAGYWFPRWTPYLHHGFGYPIHNFYAPLVHIVGGALFLFGRLDATLIYKLLEMSATLLYPFGAYLWARTFSGRAGALVAAAAYTYVPMRFFALWHQGNLSQYIAMGLFAWLFWSIARTAQRPSLRQSVYVGVFFALIVLTHHPSGFLIAPFAGLYVLASAISMRSPKQFILGSVGLAIGLALSAIFWLPAIGEFAYVQIQRVQSGMFDATANLIPLSELLAVMMPTPSNQHNQPSFFSVGALQAILAVLGSILAWRMPIMARTNAWFGGGVLLLTVFLMTPQAAWLWTNLPVANLVVFPWRLLGIAALAVIPSIALLVQCLPRRFETRIGLTLILLLFAFSLPMLYAHLSFYTVPENTPAEAFRYEQRTGNLGLTSGNEYLPIWAEARPQSGIPEAHEAFEWRIDPYTGLLPSTLTLQRLTDCPRGSTCYALKNPEPFLFVFNQLYYVGWDVRVDGQPQDAQPHSEEGLLAVAIPAGEHTLAVRYGGTPLQHFSTLMSVGCALACVGLWWRGRGQSIPSTAPTATTSAILPIGMSAGMVAFLLLHHTVLLPHTDFMRPFVPVDKLPIQTHLDETFGDSLRLVGYTLSSTTVQHGETLALRLFWVREDDRPIATTGQVQLLDRTERNVWGRADSTLLGNPTMGGWQVGNYGVDTYLLTVNAEIPPFVGILRFNNTAINTSAPLANVRVLGDYRTLADDLFTPQDVRFGGTIALLGTHYADACLTLRWRAERQDIPEAVVFIHALDEAGDFLGGFDAPPFNETYPTHDWQAGQVLDDTHCLSLPEATRTLAIGWYDRATVTRFTATQAGAPLQDNVLRLPIPNP